MTLKHALVALLATAASAIEITVGTAAKAGSDNPYGLMHEVSLRVLCGST